MSKNVLKDDWKQIRGEAKAWWSKLTDDDLEQVDGRFDILASLLQEKYGHTCVHAIEEIDKRVTEYEARPKKKPLPRNFVSWYRIWFSE